MYAGPCMPLLYSVQVLEILGTLSIEVQGREEYISKCVDGIKLARQKSFLIEEQAKELVRRAKEEAERKAKDAEVQAALAAQEKAKKDALEAEKRQTLIEELLREEEEAAAKQVGLTRRRWATSRAWATGGLEPDRMRWQASASKAGKKNKKTGKKNKVKGKAKDNKDMPNSKGKWATWEPCAVLPTPLHTLLHPL